MVEEHAIVYRGVEAPAVRPPGQPKAAEPADVARSVDPSGPLLFRYSALTFNGHRIHYDRKYVTEVEGYPGLIVHGPLQATLLILLGGDLKGAPLESFAFRAVKPLFDLAPFTISGRRSDAGLSLWAADAAGERTMQAEGREGNRVRSSSLRGAEATKQSIQPRGRDGLLRFARNDGVTPLRARPHRMTRAPLPFMIASTSLTLTIEVSPGVVMASAPCAAPYSTAACGPLPSMKP